MSLSVNYPTTRPSLTLDFINTQALDPRITFTRASSATYFDAAGVLRSAPAGQARFDYNPSTLTPLGLLIEEQRTNSIRNNTMQGAVAGTPGTLPTDWAVTSAAGLTTNVIGTGTTAGITWIDVQIVGTSSATPYQLSFDGNTAIAASATQAWTGSFWVAQVAGTTTNITATNVRVSARDSGGSTISVSDSAAITLSSTLTRYFSTFASLPASSAFVQESLRLAVTNGAAIDITLRIGLPQLELGAFATSVIPTETVAVTRNADVASMTGVNFSSWFNNAEGTLYSEATFTNIVSFNTVAAFGDGVSTDNSIRTIQWNNGSDRIFIVTNSGVAQATFSSTGQVGTAKFAGAYKFNDVNASKNGSIGTNDTSAIIPTVNAFYIGQSLLNTFVLNGHIRKLAYYPFRLTNAQLQALTS